MKEEIKKLELIYLKKWNRNIELYLSCVDFIDKKRKKERGYIHYILDNTFTRPPLTPHPSPLTPTYIEYKYS